VTKISQQKLTEVYQQKKHSLDVVVKTQEWSRKNCFAIWHNIEPKPRNQSSENFIKFLVAKENFELLSNMVEHSEDLLYFIAFPTSYLVD